MSILTPDIARPTGLLRPLARVEVPRHHLLYSHLDRIRSQCVPDRAGGRLTLLPASRFPEIAELARESDPYWESTSDHVQLVAGRLGIDDHVYLGLLVVAGDFDQLQVQLWMAVDHCRVGIGDLRELDAISDGSMRWVSSTGRLVPMNVQIVRSR